MSEAPSHWSSWFALPCVRFGCTGYALRVSAEPFVQSDEAGNVNLGETRVWACAQCGTRLRLSLNPDFADELGELPKDVRPSSFGLARSEAERVASEPASTVPRFVDAQGEPIGLPVDELDPARYRPGSEEP